MLHKQKCFRVTDIFRYPLGDITLVKRYTPLETHCYDCIDCSKGPGDSDICADEQVVGEKPL